MKIGQLYGPGALERVNDYSKSSHTGFPINSEKGHALQLGIPLM